MSKARKPKKEQSAPTTILVDTCVWLDIAKDYRSQPLLSVVEQLVSSGRIVLMVPQIIVDEFSNNKARIIEESRRSLSGVIRRVKDVVDRSGEGRRKASVLKQLSDIDHRAATLGEAVNESIGRIEKLLASVPPIVTSDVAKLRAADRAITKMAPFHRQKNGINDAILIEIYAAAVAENGSDGMRFAFVTHNKHDFSPANADERTPHPDIASCFGVNSSYSTNLGELLNEIASDIVDDIRFEHEWTEEPRRFSEILSSISELTDKVWYNRHQNWKYLIEKGKIKIVEKETFPIKDHARRPIQRDIWEGALRAAKKVEKKYGAENLGPWTDFEWGMINGKLSALRWVLGDEWDMLDT